IASDASSVVASDVDSLTHSAVLNITKNDGLTTIQAGQTDTYSIVVSNSGPNDAYNVVVSDTVSSYFTSITSPALPAGVTYDSVTHQWSIADLGIGSANAVTLEIQGTILATDPNSTFVNSVTAIASDFSGT